MRHWLLERLGEFGDQPALVWHDRDHSYRELRDAVGAWRDRLADWRIHEGECVVLRGGYSPGVCGALLALILNRNVIVPVSPSAVDVDAKLLELAQADAVIAFDDDDASTSRRIGAAQGVHPLLRQLRQAGAPGLLLFTSGSTGERKAVLLDVDRLLEKFSKRRPPFRTLVFMELDHIGGFNTLFHVLCDGGTLVPLRERTPPAVARAIERHRVQLLPTTPTFLNMLLVSEAYREHDLSSLELITYGTEPMPESTLLALNAVLPKVRFKQTYGLSELGILPSASKDSQSPWLRLGGDGFETKVVDGTLWIRARSAMLGYLNAPSPFDADGWLNTGDAVEVQGDYLRILGRASEAINVGGEKVYPAEVESVLLRMENVRDATVYGKRNPVTGNVVVAALRLLRPEDPLRLDQRMREFCDGRLQPYKIPVLLQIDDEERHSARFKKTRSEFQNTSNTGPGDRT
ncbi:MAG TPA: AMP-binding protein [Pirellulales bacterium]|nr:AMP-binding protein [Pirellulales bacterium]